MKSKIPDGLYYEGPKEYLVVIPKKTKTFTTLKAAQFFFNKWMGKDKWSGK